MDQEIIKRDAAGLSQGEQDHGRLLEENDRAMAEQTAAVQREVQALKGYLFMQILNGMLQEVMYFRDPWEIVAQKEGQFMKEQQGPIAGYWVESWRTGEDSYSGNLYFELDPGKYLRVPVST